MIDAGIDQFGAGQIINIPQIGAVYFKSRIHVEQIESLRKRALGRQMRAAGTLAQRKAIGFAVTRRAQRITDEFEADRPAVQLPLRLDAQRLCFVRVTAVLDSDRSVELSVFLRVL